MIADEPSEEKATFMNYVSSSPIFESEGATQSPLRKALSPINLNINAKPHEKLSDTDQHCSVPETNSPKTPFTATCGSNQLLLIGTPLDKFSARSTSLKVHG